MLNLILLVAGVAGAAWWLETQPCCADCAGGTPETPSPAGTEPAQDQSKHACDRTGGETEAQWRARIAGLPCAASVPPPILTAPAPEMEETPEIPVASARGEPNYNTPPIMVPRISTDWSLS